MISRYKKGSFTIEAAIIVPFTLFLMLTVLQMGISFYQEACLRKRSAKWDSFHAVSMFYKGQMLEEFEKEFLEDGL